MAAPERIRRLIETFEQNQHEYRSHKNETELRRQFLDPFFEALGWDVDNTKGYDERSKEVAHEYSVEIDELVYQLYGLSDDEIRIVEDRHPMP